MTEISMSAESDLAGVILATDPPFDLYLTLRDGDGKVRWSGSIHQYSLVGYNGLNLRTEPVRNSIDRAVENFRASTEFKFREAGLL